MLCLKSVSFLCLSVGRKSPKKQNRVRTHTWFSGFSTAFPLLILLCYCLVPKVAAFIRRRIMAGFPMGIRELQACLCGGIRRKGNKLSRPRDGDTSFPDLPGAGYLHLGGLGARRRRPWGILLVCLRKLEVLKATRDAKLQLEHCPCLETRASRTKRVEKKISTSSSWALCQLPRSST